MGDYENGENILFIFGFGRSMVFQLNDITDLFPGKMDKTHHRRDVYEILESMTCYS